MRDAKIGGDCLVIKIIEPGTRRITECTECGCKFSYENEDIEGHELYLVDLLLAGISYIERPQCGKEIRLKTTT